MGIKGVQMIGLFALVSTALYAVSCMLPMHKTKFFLGPTPISFAEMRTHSTFMTFPEGGSMLCSRVKDNVPFGKEKDGKKEKDTLEKFCDGLDGRHDIEDVYQNFCTPVMKFIWPGMCDGLKHAYLGGIFLIIAISMNTVLQGMGVYLLFDYTTRKANPQYRVIGSSLVAGGMMLMVVAFLVYWLLVIEKLNSMRSWRFFALSTGKNAGGSAGFIILMCGVIVQLCSMAFFPWIMQEDKEDDYFDNKMLKQEGGQYYGTMGGQQQQQPMMMGMQQQPMGFGMAQGGMMTTMQPAGFVAGPMTTTTMETTVMMTGPAATYSPGPTVPVELGNRPGF